VRREGTEPLLSVGLKESIQGRQEEKIRNGNWGKIRTRRVESPKKEELKEMVLDGGGGGGALLGSIEPHPESLPEPNDESRRPKKNPKWPTTKSTSTWDQEKKSPSKRNYPKCRPTLCSDLGRESESLDRQICSKRLERRLKAWKIQRRGDDDHCAFLRRTPDHNPTRTVKVGKKAKQVYDIEKRIPAAIDV